MTDTPKDGLLLGKNTPVVDEYSPDLLFPIPRSQARDSLFGDQSLPFHGVDIWHAYELSWLNDAGVPQVRVGRFTIPATSPNLVESKSFKLYLNSLNFTRFESEAAASETIVADVSAAAGAPVELELLRLEDPSLAGADLPAQCIDDQAITIDEQSPSAALLRCGPQQADESLYSNLLRSLCPATGQPDWATVWIDYQGPELDRQAMLQYLIAFRKHQDFHEQCVERMFADILNACGPKQLTIQAFYTRRGGLDINPFRSTDSGATPRPRLNRQ